MPPIYPTLNSIISHYGEFPAVSITLSVDLSIDELSTTNSFEIISIL